MWNFKPIHWLETNWPNFRQLIWKAAFSFGPNLPKQFSVTKQNSYKDFLVQAIYLLDKRKQYNIKFEAFLAARNKLTNFAVPDLEKSIQFCLKHSKSLQCHWIKLFPNFLVQAIYLSDKRNQYNIKFEAFSAARNKLTNIGGAWFGKQHSVLAPTFHSPSVSLNKTAGKVFGSSNLPFRKKKPLKFEICTLFGSLKQIHHFLGGWFGKEHSLLAETLSSPSVSLNKTLGKVFG